eukprot:CAMPEP_0203890180 /NCGR_PEP_ID=MMETSP0359-20131031/33630_1 /ASSEMBLY_ACC=CAM_ASM_000338 /TAXON_ID=268821 /ORGANISM="Scrippsiella Hangoei, Strain SHTV-5" /LENGTH=333 /DNA_ID=CAMNT_0050811741 /DNA_START=353 /DNA_END=1354 /DNA_ORIENTATION=+
MAAKLAPQMFSKVPGPSMEGKHSKDSWTALTPEALSLAAVNGAQIAEGPVRIVLDADDARSEPLCEPQEHPEVAAIDVDAHVVRLQWRTVGGQQIGDIGHRDLMLVQADGRILEPVVEHQAVPTGLVQHFRVRAALVVLPVGLVEADLDEKTTRDPQLRQEKAEHGVLISLGKSPPTGDRKPNRHQTSGCKTPRAAWLCKKGRRQFCSATSVHLLTYGAACSAFLDPTHPTPQHMLIEPPSNQQMKTSPRDLKARSAVLRSACTLHSNGLIRSKSSALSSSQPPPHHCTSPALPPTSESSGSNVLVIMPHTAFRKTPLRQDIASRMHVACRQP